MLPRRFRLPLRQNLLTLKKYGARISRPLFTFFYSSQTDSSNPRFAVLVNRHVASCATQRNKIKRQIYQIIYELLPKISSPHDILIIAKPSFLKMGKQQIKEEIKIALKNVFKN